jgi:hypothetical protein
MIEQRIADGNTSAQAHQRTARGRISRSILGGLAMALTLLATAGVAVAGKPVIDESYANGETVYMIGPHLIPNPNPNLFAQSEELYIVAYPINPGGTDTDAKSLASGYSPQCNPCYHFGSPDIFAYHDHILSGSPGFGNHGTAGEMKGPWKIILLMYKPEVISDPSFTPAKSAAELDEREAAGMFLPIGSDPANPFEVVLPVILICPLVAPAA